MTFMVTYSMRTENLEAAAKRFLETGGLAPEGVTILARWHKVGGHGGWVIAESSDASAMGRWLLGWTDLLTFDVTPVADDATLGANLAARYAS